MKKRGEPSVCRDPLFPEFVRCQQLEDRPKTHALATPRGMPFRRNPLGWHRTQRRENNDPLLCVYGALCLRVFVAMLFS